MIVGCYTLNLYCSKQGEWDDGIHEYKEFPHEYTSEFGTRARRRARRDGWTLNINKGVALCPKCSGKRPRPLGKKEKGNAAL